eukprot:353415-Chlamydomonas_euryale.AAC.1
MKRQILGRISDGAESRSTAKLCFKWLGTESGTVPPPQSVNQAVRAFAAATRLDQAACPLRYFRYQLQAVRLFGCPAEHCMRAHQAPPPQCYFSTRTLRGTAPTKIRPVPRPDFASLT